MIFEILSPDCRAACHGLMRRMNHPSKGWGRWVNAWVTQWVNLETLTWQEITSLKPAAQVSPSARLRFPGDGAVIFQASELELQHLQWRSLVFKVPQDPDPRWPTKIDDPGSPLKCVCAFNQRLIAGFCYVLILPGKNETDPFRPYLVTLGPARKVRKQLIVKKNESAPLLSTHGARSNVFRLQGAPGAISKRSFELSPQGNPCSIVGCPRENLTETCGLCANPTSMALGERTEKQGNCHTGKWQGKQDLFPWLKHESLGWKRLCVVQHKFLVSVDVRSPEHTTPFRVHFQTEHLWKHRPSPNVCSKWVAPRAAHPLPFHLISGTWANTPHDQQMDMLAIYKIYNLGLKPIMGGRPYWIALIYIYIYR